MHDRYCRRKQCEAEIWFDGHLEVVLSRKIDMWAEKELVNEIAPGSSLMSGMQPSDNVWTSTTRLEEKRVRMDFGS